MDFVTYIDDFISYYLIYIALRCCSKYWGLILDYMSTNFPIIVFYNGHMCGGFLMTVISHVHLCFGYLFRIF